MNIPIPIFLDSNQEMLLKTPTIEEYYVEEGYRKLQSFFNVSLLEVSMNPEIFGFMANTYLEFLVGIIREANLSQEMKEMYQDMFATFEEITGAVITAQGPEYNGVLLTDEDVLRIRKAYLISIGDLDIEGNPIGGSGDDEFDQKLSAAEEKIKALRGGGKQKEDKKTSLEEVMIMLMYQLKMSPESIKQLNFYGVFRMGTFALLGAQDQISKIAAGNGLLDKDSPYKDILSI